MANNVNPTRTRPKWLYILFLIPFIATLWMPFYAKDAPTLIGLPFFYWYQFLWVIITVIITGLIYLIAD